MDLDTFKSEWQRAAAGEATPLEGATMMTMIRQETDEIRRRVRRRLRSEISIYLALVMGTSLVLIDRSPIVRLTAAAVVVAVIGVIVATLWLSERRLAHAGLDRSVRDALRDLRARLDAAGRAYLFAYTAVFAAAMLAMAGVVFARYGAGLALAGVIAIGIGATAWARASGRRYVDRLFRRYRDDLAQCLQQLE